MGIRYVRAQGSCFSDMQRHVSKSPLYALGDCILVWVNEGDFWNIDNPPVDVEADAQDRAEYERLKRKFEAT